MMQSVRSNTAVECVRRLHNGRPRNTNATIRRKSRHSHLHVTCARPENQQPQTSSDANTTTGATLENTTSSKWTSSKVLAILGLGGSIAATSYVLKDYLTFENISAVVTYMRQNPEQSLPIFVAANALSNVLVVIPASVFRLSAGAVYGFSLGSVIAFLGNFAGQVVAFVLGRYMFRGTVTPWLNKQMPTWPALEQALFQQGGAKMVTLLRLAPLWPDGMLTYALALTCVPASTFFLYTALAAIPWTLLYAYLGSATVDIAQAIVDGTAAQSAPPAVAVVFGGMSLVAVGALVSNITATLQRVLREAEASSNGK